MVLDLQNSAQVLKLLGDKTRLTMVKLLETNECCVCEFVEVFKMSQPAVSQHLRKLRDAGLVKETRRGQWIYYSLNKDSDYYPFVMSVLEHIPKQDHLLQANGSRTVCE